MILILLIVLLVIGFGGYRAGGPVYAGSGLGLVLLIVLILFLLGRLPRG